ncbi:hypothetical protein N2152v2_006507 [Parachlorella kessleri]
MPLKVGILGAANIARKICRAFTFTDCAEVVAVGSRDVNKSKQFIADCKLKNAVPYGSYQEVLDDPNVEAVYIPLPAALHLEWVTKAAAKGKHVMSEKPIALTSEDTETMMKACRAANVQFMDGTMWTHSPRTAAMREVLRDVGRLGEVREVSTLFAFQASEDFLRIDVRVKADCDALGCFDVGWYCVRAILWAFQFEVPVAVFAHGGATFNDEGVPMHIGGTLLYSDGRRGNFECGFDRALTQYLEVAGTTGTIRLDDFVIPREERKCGFTVTGNHGLREMDTYDGTEREEKIIFLERPQECYLWETFAACAEGIKAGSVADEWWPTIAALTQKVCCAVLESARNGCKEVQVQM